MMASDRESNFDMTGVSLCQPAVRMVCVIVWSESNDGEGVVDHEIVPVLALAAYVHREYAMPTYKALALHEGRYVDDVMEDPWGNEDRHLCECPWPPSQDEHRLQPLIDAMKKELRTQLKSGHASYLKWEPIVAEVRSCPCCGRSFPNGTSLALRQEKSHVEIICPGRCESWKIEKALADAVR